MQKEWLYAMLAVGPPLFLASNRPGYGGVFSGRCYIGMIALHGCVHFRVLHDHQGTRLIRGVSKDLGLLLETPVNAGNGPVEKAILPVPGVQGAAALPIGCRCHRLQLPGQVLIETPFWIPTYVYAAGEPSGQRLRVARSRHDCTSRAGRRFLAEAAKIAA